MRQKLDNWWKTTEGTEINKVYKLRRILDEILGAALCRVSRYTTMQQRRRSSKRPVSRIGYLLTGPKLEVKDHPGIYVLLSLILVGAFFVRVYRLDQLLGFYFDQGRDALVIWRLWHEKKLFLIGPVTGLEGIFLGPFYYYLIAPFYLLGGGSPIYPAIFLAFLSSLAILMLYILGKVFENRVIGLFAAVIGAFSYRLVLASRWLANPTPLLLASLLLLWSLWKIIKTKSNYWWVIVFLLVGLSLQFEAASAVFYLPLLLIFAIWQRSKVPSRKTLLTSFGVFFATLLPQILFNFRHDNILFNNFSRVLVEEKSFRLSFWEVAKVRLSFYWEVFYSKLFPNQEDIGLLFVVIVVIYILWSLRRWRENPRLVLLLLFIGTPLVGFLAFQGNYGNVWDYYLTGYYLPFILLFALGLGKFWPTRMGKIFVVTFFILFLKFNGTLSYHYLRAGVDGPTHISLGNELQAVNWVLADSNKTPFNVDVYVPPVIPHAYDYLFLWQARDRCGVDLCSMELERQVPLLYTLYEVDPPHPERLEAWLERQKGIGEVEQEIKFGGITVERRKRILTNPSNPKS